MRLVIYGAQSIALGAYRAMRALLKSNQIECFLVTKKEGNAQSLDGVPVRELKEFSEALSAKEKENVQVYIATPEAVMDEIEQGLEASGFFHYVRLDSLRWGKLEKMFFIKTGEFLPLAVYMPGDERPAVHIYKMLHEKDKKLRKGFENPSYMTNLQVGAALSSMKVAPLADNEGSNISDRNGNYSELTGLYWMWKNRIEGDAEPIAEYYGLAHYRRMLDLSEDDLLRLSMNDIDVVLPYPMPYEPDIEEHHLRYLSEAEWNAVLQALAELQPAYAECLELILKQKYFYNYNIILAKKKVLNDYCKWLFPILFRVEEIVDPDGKKMPNRFIGYIGESLETIYFLHQRDKLKIAHAGCRFLV